MRINEERERIISTPVISVMIWRARGRRADRRAEPAAAAKGPQSQLTGKGTFAAVKAGTELT